MHESIEIRLNHPYPTALRVLRACYTRTSAITRSALTTPTISQPPAISTIPLAKRALFWNILAELGRKP